jgi:hypothetical protein
LSGLEALFIGHPRDFAVQFHWQANADCFHCGSIHVTNLPQRQQKNCEWEFCVTLQRVNQEKNKRNFSIRLPEEVIALLDEIADNTGLNITRNNVVEQACEWYVRTYRANGNRALTKDDFEDLALYIRDRNGIPFRMAAEAQPDGSVSPELGSSTAPKTMRYPKGTRRKS